MDATLYIPYTPYQEDFDYDTNIDSNTYVHMLQDDYVKTNQMLNNYMNTSHHNLRQPFKQTQNQWARLKEDEVVFYDIPIKLYDMNNNDEKITTLIKYFENENMFINIFEILSYDREKDKNVKYTNTDDAESELFFWIKDSMKINNNSRLNSDIKLKMLPYKNMKLGLGKNSIATIEGCKIVQQYSPLKFAVLINKIIF